MSLHVCMCVCMCTHTQRYAHMEVMCHCMCVHTWAHVCCCIVHVWVSMCDARVCLCVSAQVSAAGGGRAGGRAAHGLTRSSHPSGCPAFVTSLWVSGVLPPWGPSDPHPWEGSPLSSESGLCAQMFVEAPPLSPLNAHVGARSSPDSGWLWKSNLH